VERGKIDTYTEPSDVFEHRCQDSTPYTRIHHSLILVQALQ